MATASTPVLDVIEEDSAQGDEPIVEPLEISEDGKLVYMPLTSKYITSVTDLLHGSFYMEEDVCVITQVAKFAESKEDLNLQVVRECTKDGVSFICLKKSEDPEKPDYVIAVALNRIEIPEDPFWETMKDRCSDQYAKTYCGHRYRLNKLDRRRHSLDKLEIEEIRQAYTDDPSLFEKFNTDRAFSHVLLCTHIEHRRVGIATKLMQFSLQCAQSLRNGINARYKIYGRDLPLVRPGIVKGAAIGDVGQQLADKLGLIQVAKTNYMFRWHTEGPVGSSCALYYKELERQVEEEEEEGSGGKKAKKEEVVVEVHHSKDSPIEPPQRIPESPISYKMLSLPYIDDSSAESSPAKPGSSKSDSSKPSPSKSSQSKTGSSKPGPSSATQ